MNYKFRLKKDNKFIGHLYIFDDPVGGGLNGGIFFSPDNGKSLYSDIPLFEYIHKMKNKKLKVDYDHKGKNENQQKQSGARNPQAGE